jgi:hypothetical protein
VAAAPHVRSLRHECRRQRGGRASSDRYRVCDRHVAAGVYSAVRRLFAFMARDTCRESRATGARTQPMLAVVRAHVREGAFSDVSGLSRMAPRHRDTPPNGSHGTPLGLAAANPCSARRRCTPSATIARLSPPSRRARGSPRRRPCRGARGRRHRHPDDPSASESARRSRRPRTWREPLVAGAAKTFASVRGPEPFKARKRLAGRVGAGGASAQVGGRMATRRSAQWGSRAPSLGRAG